MNVNDIQNITLRGLASDGKLTRTIETIALLNKSTPEGDLKQLSSGSSAKAMANGLSVDGLVNFIKQDPRRIDDVTVMLETLEALQNSIGANPQQFKQEMQQVLTYYGDQLGVRNAASAVESLMKNIGTASSLSGRAASVDRAYGYGTIGKTKDKVVKQYNASLYDDTKNLRTYDNASTVATGTGSFMLSKYSSDEGAYYLGRDIAKLQNAINTIGIKCQRRFEGTTVDGYWDKDDLSQGAIQHLTAQQQTDLEAFRKQYKSLYEQIDNLSKVVDDMPKDSLAEYNYTRGLVDNLDDTLNTTEEMTGVKNALKELEMLKGLGALKGMNAQKKDKSIGAAIEKAMGDDTTMSYF